MSDLVRLLRIWAAIPIAHVGTWLTDRAIALLPRRDREALVQAIAERPPRGGRRQ